MRQALSIVLLLTRVGHISPSCSRDRHRNTITLEVYRQNDFITRTTKGVLKKVKTHLLVFNCYGEIHKQFEVSKIYFAFITAPVHYDIYHYSIKFNSILYYLCVESTATRHITDTAQYRYT
jgi:hypothetical protein